MNKVILCGRLTKDIDVRQTTTGTAIGSFTIAVDRKPTKDGKRETDFISCKAWGKTAETMARYLGKGRKVLVEGRMQTGSYEARDGGKRYTTDVIVESFEFVDSKPAGTQEQELEIPF
jgi:single-strand DNA-binding protein